MQQARAHTYTHAHTHTHTNKHTQQHEEYILKYTSTLRHINYFFSYNESETQYANMMGMNTFLRICFIFLLVH